MKNRLRLLRAERGLSQADLALALGVSRQTVNAVETGRFDPSLPLAFAIARTLSRTARVSGCENSCQSLFASIPPSVHRHCPS